MAVKLYSWNSIWKHNINWLEALKIFKEEEDGKTPRSLENKRKNDLDKMKLMSTQLIS